MSSQTTQIRSMLAATAIFAVALVGALTSSPQRAVSAPERLAAAQRLGQVGIEPQLAQAAQQRPARRLRVRLMLAPQPVLAAAQRPSIRELIEARDSDRLREAARRSPEEITALEKAAARAGERRFERAIARLGDEARASEADLGRVEDLLAKLGGEVLERELIPASVIARIDGSALDRLAGSPLILSVWAAPKGRPLLDAAVPASGAPDWWAAGYTGGEGASDQVSVDVATLGESQQPDHPAFAGVQLFDLGGGVSDHGTHVGGVIASQDATYKGVAPGVDSLIGASGHGVALGLDFDGDPGADDPAEVMNRSFGSPATDDDNDVYKDMAIAIFDVGLAEAAGNEGTSGDPTPTVNAVGHNAMSVASAFDDNNSDPTDDVLSGSSSLGPSPAGRKKPDITAYGAQIIGPDSRWNDPPSNPDFTSESGTSFSSPMVAASMALLEGAGIGDPIAQRAILINSARDWIGKNNNLNGWSSGSQQGWRPEVGWGQLDLSAALADRGNYEMSEVGEGKARFFRASTAPGQKATLAWELRGIFDPDKPPYPEPGSDAAPYTLTDLDLSQYRAADLGAIPPPPDLGHGGGPDAGDPNDNVEQVRAPSGGIDVIYKVEPKSTIEGAAAEPFAIASAEPLAELAAPAVIPTSVAISDAGAVNCSTDVAISAAARNPSADLDATGAQLALGLPAGLELVSGPAAQQLGGGVLARSASSATHSWTVRASASGSYELAIEGSGGVMGSTFTDTETVSLLADCDPPALTLEGPQGRIADNRPTFSWQADEPASYECRIDAAAFAPCSSPFTSPALEDGSHSFQLRATDDLGNAGISERSFTTDTQGPAVQVTEGREGASRNSNAQFSFRSAADDLERFECRLSPQEGWGPCSGGSFASYSNLNHGTYTFEVRGIDKLGNRGGAAASRFEVDLEVTDPDLSAKKVQRQRGTKVKVKIKASAQEAVRVKAKGKLKLGNRKLKLRGAAKRLEASQAKVLRLLAKTRRDQRKIVRALAGGKKVRANVSARFIDELGNRASERRVVRMR